MGFRVVLLRVGRGVVWLLLAWLVVRGVVDVVAPPPAVVAESPVPQPVAEPVDRQAPGAFAALFAREYLSWEAADAAGRADRAQRLRPFLAAHLDPQVGWAPGGGSAGQEAEATWPYRVEPREDGRWLVTVMARVTTRTEDGLVPRVLYLAVPVAAAGEGYVVADYPTLVPAPQAAALEGPGLPGDELDDGGDQVKTLLTGFFRAYVAGGGSEVAYYLVPGLSLRGLGGALQFVEVKEVSLRRVGEQTWAYALVQLADPVSGALMEQRYTLQVVERDGRWYIADLVQKGD